MLAPGAAGRIAPFAGLWVVALAATGVAGPRWLWATVPAAVVFAAITAFLLIFFRDPERAVGDGVVSAADGRVRAVELADGRWTVSVFLGVTNVHVNRFPLDATVVEVGDAGAGHRPAYRDDAGKNSRRAYQLSTEIGPVEVVQITGIAARRLVSFVRTGAAGKKGDRFGMIVLGSRVDVHLPAARVAPTVRVGERVWGGRTTIARLLP